MTIKYGELTIIINKDQTIIDAFFNWVNNKTKIESHTHIFLFDDGIIFDDTSIKDLNFKFLNNILDMMPMYFEIPLKNKTYFCKSNNNIKTPKIFFDNLFKSYSKYDPSVNIKDSLYNEIYYCIHKHLEEQDVFGIKQIPGGEYSRRFQFAYDSEIFTKEEISYLLYYIFNECNKQFSFYNNYY